MLQDTNNTTSSFNRDLIGHNNKSILPGTNSLSSPTSSEAGTDAINLLFHLYILIYITLGKSSSAFHLPPSRASGEYDSTSSIASGNSTTTAERRQSLIMSGSRVSSPRHHPYMSPGKVYTPSIMSTLQSYRQSSDFHKQDDIVDRTSTELDNSTTDLNNRHPW